MTVFARNIISERSHHLGNQVRMVTDAVTTDYGHPAEYRDGAATWYEHNHDKNGNLVCDLDRGVTSIGYNVLNLPESVVLTGNHETYNIYDADGRKLRSVHIVAYDPVMLPSGEEITPTDTLVRDYSGGNIYENGVLERTLTPTGYYSAADSEYCHYIRDYQGNNVAVVTDINGSAKAVSATLMYPFGSELTEMSATDRYRFGGKELDTRGGLFHYDFGARHYDPVLPMFNGYDRMAEDNIHVSPFAYCHGNPVMFIDPTGMAEFWHNGEVIGTDGIDDGRILVIKNVSSSPNPEDDERVVLKTVDTSKVVDFIKTNSGKKDAFSENSDIYSSTIEIEGSAENRSQMVKIISQDSGKGGFGDNENREFGGNIKDGKVVEVSPGPVIPQNSTKKGQIELLEGYDSFHSHPSGQNNNYKPRFEQWPSTKDINSANWGGVHYVFGRYDGNVYIYTKDGVQAKMKSKYFITPKKQKK